MLGRVRDRVWQWIVDWLNAASEEAPRQALCNFEHLKREIHPADVLLVEGRSRVSEVIKIVALSPWTHAAIYIGRLVDIHDSATRERLAQFYDGDPWEPLLVESLLGRGTVVTPLSWYEKHHVRVCRPAGLLVDDVEKVVAFAIEQLGTDYDVRQLLDLARLSFPYAILPRRWRSTLFQHNAGKPTHIVCSSMIARCFQQVGYPILPVVKSAGDGEVVRFYQRNFRLFVPSDFDYSPYFRIIKFSWWGVAEDASYRRIEWGSDDAEVVAETPPKEKKQRKSGKKDDKGAGGRKGKVIDLATRALTQSVAGRFKWSG